MVGGEVGLCLIVGTREMVRVVVARWVVVMLWSERRVGQVK